MRFSKRKANMSIHLVSLFIVLSFTGFSEAVLWDRGGGLIYDDVLDITWLQDSNYAKTSGYDDDGLMNWNDAMNWVSGLEYYDSVRNVIWNDWRLPKALPVNGTHYTYPPGWPGYDYSRDGSSDIGYGISAPGTPYAGSVGSEMAHLHHNSLGNTGAFDSNGNLLPIHPFNSSFRSGGPSGHTVSFNIMYGGYWTETNYDEVHRWTFGFQDPGVDQGMQQYGWTPNLIYAWAVRDGDVGAVAAPDLTITSGSPTVTPSTAKPGDTVTISGWTEKNQGGDLWRSYSTGIYLSSDAIITSSDTLLTETVPLGVVISPWLAAGEEEAVSGTRLTIPSTTTPGTYYIGILIDFDDSISESDETNNFVSTQITVGSDTDGSYEDIAELLMPTEITLSETYFRGVTAKGNYAYGLSREGYLYTFDIEEIPALTTFESKFPIGTRVDIGKGNGLIDYQDYLYIYGWGLAVADIKDPTTPAVINMLSTSNTVINMIRHGSYLIACNYNSIEIFSLTEPSNPYKIGEMYIGTEGWSAAVYGDYLYVAGGIDNPTLYVIDFSNPLDLTMLNTLSLAELPYHMEISGDRLITSNTDSAQLWNLYNPINPVELHSISIPYSGRVCARDDENIVFDGSVYSTIGTSLNLVQSFDDHDGGQIDGFPFGSDVTNIEGYRVILLTQNERILVLRNEMSRALREITVDTTTLHIEEGLNESFNISGGAIPYTATSEDASVATVSLSGDTVTVTGVSEGTATITVVDSDSNTAEVTVVVTESSSPEINLVSPRDNDMLSHSGEGGHLVVMFTSHPNAESYMLNVNLVDMYRVLGEVPLLIPLELPREGNIFDPGTGGTEGFSCSFGMCTYAIEFSQESWDGLAQWDLEWNIDALNDTGRVIGSSETWSFKFQPIGSVTLSSPVDGASFDKTTGTAPRFSWEVYTGADTYTVLLGKVSGLAYDPFIPFPGQVFNSLPLDDATWEDMPTGEWCWTVWAYDERDNLATPTFGISCFEVED